MKESQKFKTSIESEGNHASSFTSIFLLLLFLILILSSPFPHLFSPLFPLSPDCPPPPPPFSSSSCFPPSLSLMISMMIVYTRSQDNGKSWSQAWLIESTRSACMFPPPPPPPPLPICLLLFFLLLLLHHHLLFFFLLLLLLLIFLLLADGLADVDPSISCRPSDGVCLVCWSSTNTSDESDSKIRCARTNTTGT